MSKAIPTKTVKVHLIEVKRGGEGIITQGADYDLRILKAQHPPENVRVVQKDYDVIKIPDDAAHLHDQLCRKYDTKNVKIVGRVFPSPEQLAQFTGVSVRFTDTDPDSGPQKSVQRESGREARLAAAEAEEKAKGNKGSKAPIKQDPVPPTGDQGAAAGTGAPVADGVKLGDAAAAKA